VQAIINRISSLLDRGLSIGAADDDGEDVRLRKRGLLMVVWGVVLLAPIWSVVYLALGRPLSAAIPGTYVVISLISLAMVARRGWSDGLRSSQVILILFLPALLMWSLGGFVLGSAVIIWAFLATLGALVFSSRREAMTIFGVFVALVLLSGVFDARLSEAVEPLPGAVVRMFFVLNIVAVSVVAFATLLWFIFQRDRARAAVRTALEELDVERARSEALLRRILPDRVALRLKDGERVIADRYEAVTVLFADIVDFTPVAAGLAPDALVGFLDGIFSDMDEVTAEHGVVRIKTIGDAYMAVAGAPDVMPAADGARAATRAALAMLERVRDNHRGASIRIGLHTGPAVAGVIGQRTLAYDLWGDAVNVASRMESHGVPGSVQLSPRTSW